MPIENDFPFLMEKGHIVSLVGGGGKTTLMYAMAAHCVRKNWHVLVTTTTHIMRPPGTVWAPDGRGAFPSVGTRQLCRCRNSGSRREQTVPPQKQLEHWMQLADIVLIEADGSRRMPCKAPAAHEPVLLPAVRYRACGCRRFCTGGITRKRMLPGQNWHSRFCVSREMLY